MREIDRRSKDFYLRNEVKINGMTLKQIKNKSRQPINIVSMAQKDFFTNIRKNDWLKVVRLLRSEQS